MTNTFYVSNTGFDKNIGTSIEKPFCTMEKVNTLELHPGDKVLFQCGGTFAGELNLHYSGTQENPIIIGSYGEGSKPTLTGAVVTNNWEPSAHNRFFKRVTSPVYQVYANDKLLDLARIPAKGFYAIESGDKNTLTDNQHLHLNYDLTGATLRIRAVNWQYETNRVASHTDGTITFAESMVYQANPRYGYLLDNKLEFLTEPGQWFWDAADMQFYFIPVDSGNVNDQKIELVIFKNGITISENTSFIEISNLHLEKYENAAIQGLGHSSHISISDCNINDVHVYGITLEINSETYTIKNNTISDIRGRGITTMESSNNVIIDNVVDRIGLYPGYGFDGVNNGISIAILKTEVKFKLSSATFAQLQTQNIPVDVLNQLESLIDLPYADEKFLIEAIEIILGHFLAKQYLTIIMPLVNAEAKAQKLESTNNRVAYNRVDQAGYAGIRIDGNNSIAECNVIKNTLLHMNDGGALYSWAQNEDYAHHNIFKNNIIIDAVGSCVATANDLAYAYGIYTDNKCHHLTLENNTVVGTVGGILINDEAHHQKVIGNTLYNNQMGLVFSEYFMPDTLVECEAYDNIIFAKKRNQRALFVECRCRDKFVPGLLNKNLYANPYYPFPIIALTYKDNVRSFKEYTLGSWQKFYGQDAESTTIATANHDAGGQQSHILINDTKVAKAFEVPTDLIYTDVYGNVLEKTVKIEPFSSMIILQK